ncbi:vitelline membrane protein 15a-1-like [Toxorhynchites rutilus septentrionalis]|uniref:vitelline membrane protein 15a-1-like n=1 Tax=Toxorhynchites rutilus septentrionalis TaxID=329112 RepID=UPI0024793E05|nr:vitelline membrane protein 15a-1-like [Toxorhynchites rutilus septentrionalis]
MKSFCILAIFAVFCVLGSLAAPSYGGGYGGGHATIHTYAAKAPAVKCGSSLLVGCAPQVAHAPCSPSKSGGGYGGGHAAASYGGGHAAPAPSYGGGYRAFEHEVDELEE